MKNSTLCRAMLLWTIGLLAAIGCSSRQHGTNQPAPSLSTRVSVATPEKATVEPSDAVAPVADKLVRDYNTRNIGSPGWRRVSMELITDGAVSKTFTVVNLWRDVGESVQTLFFLQEPRGLTGTAYLLQEYVDRIPNMNIHLYLPAGERRVLELSAANFDEGLLGSDFTYNDVQMRLPVAGYHYRLLGKSNLRNEPVWVLEGEPSLDLTRRACRWARARFYLARNFQFLLGADYFADSDNQNSLLKQMRAIAFEQIGGVWTATKMTMHRSENSATLLSMKDVRFGVASFDPTFFDAAELPSLTEKLGKGSFLKSGVE